MASYLGHGVGNAFSSFASLMAHSAPFFPPQSAFLTASPSPSVFANPPSAAPLAESEPVFSGNKDWCEQNYAITPYIAEFYNSISSLVILLIGIAGLYVCRKQRRRTLQSTRDGFTVSQQSFAHIPHPNWPETRFSLAYLVLCFVGIGSFWFHATLQYYAEAFDELPMCYWVLVMLYMLLETEAPADRRKYRYLPVCMVAYAVLNTLAYFYMSTVYGELDQQQTPKVYCVKEMNATQDMLYKISVKRSCCSGDHLTSPPDCLSSLSRTHP